MRYLVLILLLLAQGALAQVQPNREQQRTIRDFERGDVKAMDSLVRYDAEVAVPPFVAALSNRDPRQRRLGAEGLERLSRESKTRRLLTAPVREALQQAMEDADIGTVAAATEAMSRLGRKTESLVPYRERVLAESDSAFLRFRAARGLIGHADAERLIHDLLVFLARGESDAYTESFGARQTGINNSKAAEAALANLVNRHGESVLPMLLDALARPEPAQIPLLRVIHPLRGRVPDWTSLLLARLDSPFRDAEDTVLSLLKDLREPAQAAQWVPVVAARLPQIKEPSTAFSALDAQAGASLAAQGALAAWVRDPAKHERSRRLAFSAMAKAAHPKHSRAGPEGRERALQEALDVARDVLLQPGPPKTLVDHLLSEARDIMGDRAALAAWRLDVLELGPEPAISRLLISWIRSDGEQARVHLDRLRPWLANPETGPLAHSAMTALDPAWEARDQRAQRLGRHPLALPRLDTDTSERSKLLMREYTQALRSADLAAIRGLIARGLPVNRPVRVQTSPRITDLSVLDELLNYCKTRFLNDTQLAELTHMLIAAGAEPDRLRSATRTVLEAAIDARCPVALQEALRDG